MSENIFSDISHGIKCNFYCVLLLTSISSTALISSGITRLSIIGMNDSIGWLILALPCLCILTIFMSFGCFCSYMFIHILKDYHNKYINTNQMDDNTHINDNTNM